MPAQSQAKKQITAWVDKNVEHFQHCADAIWSYAELGLEERLSAGLLISTLRDRGFTVQQGVAGMPTAFVATWGEGGATIGFGAEYDSLPGLSQKPQAQKQPLVEGGPGHGCGHNLLGVGGVMAAIAVKQWLEVSGTPGTVKVLGSPAEELCVGKPFMAQAGLLHGFDAILDWHPWKYTGADHTTCNAYFNLRYHFYGQTAHGNAPWLGRSAVDAALLMGHALEMLREHIPPGNQDAANTLNCSFPNLGPEYPNVVPDRASVWVTGRITNSEEIERILPRVEACAQGAALATGTEVEGQFICASHERIPNETLTYAVDRNLQELGPLTFSPEEHEFARELQRQVQLEPLGMAEELAPVHGGSAGVSDNAEYSWFAPLTMLRVAAVPAGVGMHTWPATASVSGSIGHKAMAYAAKALACTALDLFVDPELRETAKAEHAQRLKGCPYRSLMPEHTTAPLGINQKVMHKYGEQLKEHHLREPFNSTWPD